VSRDRGSAVGLALLAIAYLLANRRYPLDTLAVPGPGLFPLIAGLALLALAGWQFTIVRPAAPGGDARERGESATIRGPLVLALVLVVYAALLPRLGFVPVSLALVFVASRLMGRAGWWRPAALAIGVTIASYVVFVTWLGVPLP